MNEHANALIGFYAGQSTDHEGRTLEDIWAMPPFWLEHTHDYIQWLFPVPEAGRFNGFAPLLDEEAQAAFAGSDEFRQRQCRLLDVMLGFFGLELKSEGIVGLLTSVRKSISG